MDAFKETEEVYAGNVLNTGTTFNPAVQGDQVSLINTAQPDRRHHHCESAVAGRLAQ